MTTMRASSIPPALNDSEGRAQEEEEIDAIVAWLVRAALLIQAFAGR
jgi:hypothetical protein